MLVVSRSAPDLPEGVIACASIEEAIEHARAAGEDELFVAGGGEIYRQTMGLADTLHVTEVDLQIEGDAHFPEIDLELWREVERDVREPDEANRVPYAFVRYERKRRERA